MSDNFMNNANATSVVTAIGNKIKARDKTFYGTEEQWAALTTAQKKEYDFKATPDGGARSSSIFVLANKFDRSDLYSTEEKIVGRWTDGKPLYQKTFTGTSSTYSDSGSRRIFNVELDSTVDLKGAQGFVKIVDATTSNFIGVENIIGSTAFGADNNVQFAVQVGKFAIGSGGAFKNVLVYACATSIGVTDIEYYVTIQYTKTTDSPILIGSDTDYTTSEKMIGTWIDGKPLYQKTVPITITVNTDLTSVTSYADVSALNVDNIVDVRGMLFQGTSPSSAQTPISFSSWVNADAMVKYIVQPWFNKDNNRLCIDCNRLSYSGKIAYITIQYTKTTD